MEINGGEKPLNPVDYPLPKTMGLNDNGETLKINELRMNKILSNEILVLIKSKKVHWLRKEFELNIQ